MNPSLQTPRLLPRTSAPRVALLVETSTSWGTRIIEGVARYANLHGWRLDLETSAKYESSTLSKDWNGCGIIARVTTQKLADQILESGCPAVNVSWYDFGSPGIARCTADCNAAARIAANHLRECGLRNMAYCGSWRRLGYSDRFFTAFCDHLGPDFSCNRFVAPSDMAAFSRAEQIAELGHWLLQLPPRVGLLAFDSEVGYLLADACHGCGRSIPEDVAILSGEHDDLFTAIASPPLSSIDLAPQSVGFEAAAHLDHMLTTGEMLPDILVPPTGILRRHSTDLLSHPDRDLAAALRFIRENAHRPIQVSDILDELTISRRKLEQKFQNLLARSPAAEIRRERVDRVKQLLRSTSYSIDMIASCCGFECGIALTQAFRREMGISPSSFRKRNI